MEKPRFYFTGQLTVLSYLGGFRPALGIDYRVGWACFGAGGALKAEALVNDGITVFAAHC